MIAIYLDENWLIGLKFTFQKSLAAQESTSEVEFVVIDCFQYFSTNDEKLLKKLLSPNYLICKLHIFIWARILFKKLQTVSRAAKCSEIISERAFLIYTPSFHKIQLDLVIRNSSNKPKLLSLIFSS